MILSITSPDLLPALEANLVAFWASYGRGEGCRLESTGDVVWFYTGVQNPICNGVVSATGQTGPLDAAHAGLQQCIAARGAPAFWWIGPLAPEGLGEILTEKGMQIVGDMPGMAIDLEGLPDTRPPPRGLTVEIVDSRERQVVWAKTCALGTDFDEPTADAFAKVESTLSDPAYRNQTRYIGVVDGQPVASSCLVLESGVAGVYAVATMEAARRRGIGRYMTEVALRDARAQGYRVAILQASSMGHPIYQRLGFRDVCTYQLYLQS